ncbi:MAG: dTMP kinase [Candidatus Riflebacteria bacterium]|nr:dTMP kinase [Candidatus Riflebacteria bacterium]
MRSGIFVTFEGPEGSGKTTQVKLLAESLEQQGVAYMTTREPGGTDLADRLRSILIESETPLDAKTEFLLLLTARSHHVETAIRPALDEGKVVICDRFSDSSVCYQGAGRGINRDTIILLNDFATSGLAPDLTFLMDVPSEEGLDRLGRSNRGLARFEKEGLEFHRRVRDCYLELAAASPDRFVIIPAMRTVREVADDIYAALWAAFPTLTKDR